MSVYVAICPKCRRKVGVARPGEIVGVDDPKTACPFCNTEISGKAGFDVETPVEEETEVDLLSVE